MEGENIIFGYVIFEITLRHPNEEGDQELRYMSLEFRGENWERINLGAISINEI